MPLSLLDPSRDHRHRFETGSRHPPAGRRPAWASCQTGTMSLPFERVPSRLRASPRARSRSPSQTRPPMRMRCSPRAQVRCRRRGGRCLPRALPHRLRDRRPRDAGCRARRRRGVHRAAGRGIRRSLPDARGRSAAAGRATASTTAPSSSTAARCWASRRSRICPRTASSTRRRWYAPGDGQVGQDIRVGELEAPFGPDLLFEALDVPGLVVHAEVCEDVWVIPAVLVGRPLGRHRCC